VQAGPLLKERRLGGDILWFTEVAEADTHEPEPLLGA